ncbi:hypothetical protein Tco_1139232 [Tanacetum coccineum]
MNGGKIQLARSEVSRQSIIRDFIHTVVSRLQTSMEYRRSLAISLSYTAEDLMNVFLDVPVNASADKTRCSIQDGDSSSSQPKPQDTTPSDAATRAKTLLLCIF